MVVSKFGPLTSVIHRSMRQGYPPLTPTVLEISTRPRCGPVVDFCVGKEVLCSKLTVTDTPSRRSAANMNHFPVVRSMLPLGKVYAGKVQRWRLAGKRGANGWL